jgi:putative DNA primase/helicase
MPAHCAYTLNSTFITTRARNFTSVKIAVAMAGLRGLGLTASRRVSEETFFSLSHRRPPVETTNNISSSPALEELQKLRQWVCYNGDKQPKNPRTGINASPTNPDHWGEFEVALKRFESDSNIHGIGFVFTKGDDYFGVDLDLCFDDEGNLKDWGREFLDVVSTYTEYSPSRKGLHVIGRKRDLELYGGRKGTEKLWEVFWDGKKEKREDIEFYTSRRYFTLTGEIFEGRDTIRECQDGFVEMLDFYYPGWMEGNVPQKEKPPVNADLHADLSKEKFEALYENNPQFKASWDRKRPELQDDDSAYDMSLAVFAVDNKWSDDEIAALIRANRERYDDKGKIDREDYYQRTIAEARELVKKRGEEKGSCTDTEGNNTDAGNAARFEKRFKDKLIYVIGRGWFKWTEKRWESIEMVSEYAIKVAKDLFKEVAEATGRTERRELSRFANNSHSVARLEAMVKLSRPKLEIDIKKLDSDPWLLNVKNGILNLKTGKLLDHDPKKYQTKMVSLDFDPTAPCLRWNQFIDEVTCGDRDLAGYLQKAFGYALTGTVAEQSFFVLIGRGANGKSTLLNVIKRVMGDYAATCSSDLFVVKQYGGSSSCGLMKLNGVRLATVSEVGVGKKLDEPILKQITGGDAISGRFMRENEFEFMPQFTVFLACNSFPRVEENNFAIWRRIKTIPFKYQADDEGVDKFLAEKLLKESHGILTWLVEGCLSWQEQKLKEPREMRTTIESLRCQNDDLRRFIIEHVEKNAGSFLPFREAFEEFERFMKGGKTITKKEFSRDMERNGYSTIDKWLDGKTTSVFKGLKLIDQLNLPN